MSTDGTIQSLDRGLLVLRLLSEQGPMTATALAKALGVHQSSASRLLGSLEKAGFVYKPDFHSFALDYGALVFAGKALQCFPAIERCAQVCNQITRKLGVNATVALLKDDHLVYLTRTNSDSSLVLINNSAYPIHRSSLGMILAFDRGRENALELFKRSIAEVERHEGVTRENAGDRTAQEAEELYDSVAREVKKNGFLYLSDYGKNRVNGAQSFLLDRERAALAIFSAKERISSSAMKEHLEQGVREITAFKRA